MMNCITIEKVQSQSAILVTAKLAAVIWNEHYIPIIGQEQVNYMVNTFQSPDAIEKQIKDENYEYYLIYHLTEPSGYISIRKNVDELFLSKFYVIKERRGTGLGKEGFRFIRQRAVDLGAKTIKLTVNKYNINSIKAYEKMGFVNTGSLITDIGSGFVMDDFMMSYEL
jgi:GNAT superfamily N-acetyltransferase